jgi:hypothetical protein
MVIRHEDDEERVELVPLSLPLKAATVHWLAMLSEGADDVAAEIIAGMIEAIRLDDEAAHSTKH